MCEANAPIPEAAYRAVYNFLKFQVEINARDSDIFDKEGKLLTASADYPIVWHEYVHYLQNVTTTIGARIFLNWIAVLRSFSDAVHARNPLTVPMRSDLANPFPNVLHGLFAETSRLMGLETPLDRAPPSSPWF
jgi:hypothetical protein